MKRLGNGWETAGDFRRRQDYGLYEYTTYAYRTPRT